MNLKEAELVVVSEETYNLCEGGKGGFGYINSEGLNKSINQKQVARKQFQKNATTILLSDEYKWAKQKGGHSRMNNMPSFKGMNHTNETKKKISEANKKLVKEQNSQYGSFWITNGQENKKCREKIPDGWKKGRFLGPIV